ncbi:MAG: DUF4037 domain-containing protein [Actinobacteria bacterium]|nr:MAG: DUF4037 domain-containing protein [Actinomycetota bacterium]
MPDFIPGIELARGYYDDVVGPLIGATPHAAGRLGWGSDVLGFDTARSTDHGWGPHLHVFVAAEEVKPLRARIEEGIPQDYLGWPTRFGWDEVVPRSWVEVFTLDEWLPRHFGCDPRPAPTTLQWLVLPQQLLLEVVGGGLFHDDDGSLTSLREELAWYPDDVWLWLLACQWQRIGQEEAFVGRTAEVGDDLGSSVVAARLTRDLMRLCFLIERRYAPYSKWFGTAFRTLDAASELGPLLETGELGGAYEAVARRHNALGVTDALEPKLRPFYGRPFPVIFAERFAAACMERVEDPWLRSLPPIGAIDQWCDSTDVLSKPAVLRDAAAIYGEPSIPRSETRHI